MADPYLKPPAGPTGGGPVMLSPSDAARVTAVVRFVERLQKNGLAPLTNGPRADVQAFAKALTGAGGIAAGNASGSAPGSGTVTLATSGPPWVAGTATVTAYNPGSAAVGANKWVTLGWVNGVWEVVVEAC